MHILIEIAAALAAGYLAFCLVMYLSQNRLVFYPAIGKEVTGTPDQVGLTYETVSLATADGEILHGWFVPAPDSTKEANASVVLFFHGNAGNISHRLDTMLMFERLGMGSFFIDYRGYGNSTGKPSEQGTYTDAAAAWNYLTVTRQLRASQIVIFGESLGGAVAAWLAERHVPRALVLESTFTSIPEVAADHYPALPVRLLARIRYDSRARLNSIDCPVFVAHSRDDELIAFKHGRKLFDAAKSPKQFLEMRGGHNEAFIFAQPAWSAALATFLGSVP
jgi:uncharacterized protein